MDYNSFLTRDYKSLTTPVSKPTAQWTSLHTLIILFSITSIVTVLVLASPDAKATRTEHTLISQEIPTLRPIQQITLPLSIPTAKTTVKEITRTETAPHWSTFKIKAGDSLAYLFKKHNIPANQLHQIMRSGKPAQSLRTIKPGQQFRISQNEQQQVTELFYDINKQESLHVTRQAEGFNAEIIKRPIDTLSTFSSGVINSSLFESGKAAQLNDALIMQLVGIFGWDIDFALDIRKGDRFSLLYEEHFIEGTKIKDGPILAAEFTNHGKTYRAVRYTNNNGHSDYYSEDGRSMRKAFSRTPVDFRRISSRFGKRRHPTLNKIKLHTGVDYAARRGTPIKAAGDGKVTFRGRKGGYGKTVMIQHGGRYSTLYAHMSRYKKGVYAGKRVKQGQTIGYVGASGRATGPHLHYEFRVNGSHRNPLTVRLPAAAPIAKQYKDDFIAATQRVLAQLDARNATHVALNN